MSARVLIVDDDPDVREVVAFQVGLLGYTAVEVEGVAAALGAIAAATAGEGIAVVITDVDLAGEDGRIVVHACREAGIPALLMTGAEGVEAIADEPPLRVLRKPVGLEDLRTALRAALEASGGGGEPPGRR